ncbi:hypothetical protein [Streptomyces clavifer]|uniref:hypothetical protein n=1 Tax=Streptomyces clavifer TaxID=68188 RepID=UPI0036887237
MTTLPPSPDDTSSQPPLLSTHSALVLMIAVIISVTIGFLTFYSTGQSSAGVIAGLMTFGASIPVLRREIGP